jgi:hypothetical protein
MGMLIGGVIAFCVLLFVLALLAPRASEWLQLTGDKSLLAGERGAGKAPRPLARWLRKPFRSSRKAVDKSGSAGRRTRFKLPL